MAFFKKNPNETAYHEGKKHFTDVIKNTGEGGLLIWRQPEEDFNTNSTLIVMAGEQALFINGGTIEQIFGEGTYRLTTGNYPFISRLRNVLTGGISVFHCVVYFVRTAHSVEIRWGTDSPIQVRDKLLGIATKLRARGSYKVAIENPALFLQKLVGSNIRFQEQEALNAYFVSEFQSKIKSVIARAVNASDAELLGIDARLDEFSDTIQPYMQEILSQYGLRCVRFAVSAIDLDDSELRRKYDEIGMRALEERRMAAAKAAGQRDTMDILGDDWGKQQSADILRDLANNQSAGALGAMGAGVGMGLTAGTAFGEMAGQILEPVPSPRGNEAKAAAAEDPVETLTKLKRMLDAGLIEKSEYDAKKAEILRRM